MAQTDDMLRTLHDRTPNDLDRLMAQLGRIADALEQRNRIDEAMANFAQMLQRGTAPANGVEFEDYRMTPGRMEFGNDDSWEVKVNGAWRPATPAEEQKIADMNQKRQRR